MSPRHDDPPAASSNTAQAKLSLGSLFVQRRKELELDLDKVEKDTKIRQDYLRSIETGNYERLRDDIYTRGYVKNYADYLGLETAPILVLYRRERDARSSELKSRDARGKQKIGLTPIKSPRFIITPRSFVVLIVVVITGLMLAYLIYQFTGLASAPVLVLDNANEERLTSATTYLAGHVSGSADVFINDSPVLTNSGGNFREQISLVEGINRIRVSAKNRLGKSTAVTKTYVANLPKRTAGLDNKAPSNAPLQPQKFEGVQVMLKVSGQPSWLIVSADDKEIYRGTMLAGTSQSFSAADHLIISVGNAGSVSLSLTNTQVVNKDLGKIGDAGQVRQDILFKKDTQTL